MRLHDFILTNREQILAEWEEFARTCGPSSGTMDVTALRDHAGEMLGVIAEDLKTYQDREAQAEKSKGNAPTTGSETPTAAEEHGAGRAESGFTVEQMVAEYRALRASVLRLWTKAEGQLEQTDIEDMTRFNEAIDQSLAESILQFNDNVEQAKELFLAVLGHDLRTPLGAISTSAQFMLETADLAEPHLTLTQRIASSATRTIEMVGDLLDFTRSRLGGGIPVERAEMSLGKVMHGVVADLQSVYPNAEFIMDARDVMVGEWDEARLFQALTNLIGNAVEHGAPGRPITVSLDGDEESVTITIHNHGVGIPAEDLNGLFNPMKVRHAPRKPSSSGPAGNLGLGLYIAERIVRAHNGHIDVESSTEEGTTFTVHMPRHENVSAPAAPASD